MKKAITKIVTTIILFALTFTLAGCPYTANGSVIQDVSFTIAYEDVDGAQSIDATLSLYKTFAPETTKKLIKYFKEGVYENSAIVLTKSQDAVVLGEYTVSNGEYQRINDDNFETVKGEFTNNGWKTKNAIKTGALIMLRDADTSTTTSSRYNTAKIKFAVVLSANYEVFSTADYCVFGYMDTESVEALREALQDNAINEDGNVKLRYAGDRVDDVQTYENGFDYFVNDDGEYYIQGANGLIEVTSKTDDDNHALYEKIESEDLVQDIRTLPNVVFTVKNFKLK